MADFINDYRENSDLRPDVSKIIIFSVYLADYVVVRDLATLNGSVF